MREKYKVFIGEKFGRLTILSIFRKLDSQGNPVIFCSIECECGTTKDIQKTKLILGHTKSCGCLVKETASILNRTHGQSKTRLYKIWMSMRARCNNTNDKDYYNYGGRGIKVCQNWNNNFEDFMVWAINHDYNKTSTIERIDVDGDYCPENCTFIPITKQAKNRRSTRFITAFGEVKCAIDWERDIRCKVNRTTIIDRLDRGWSPEEAMTTEGGRDRKGLIC